MEKKDEKYDIELAEKINALSKSLGFTRDNQTLLEIKKTDDKNIKELHLKNGSWESSEPWFAIDTDDEQKAYAFIPADAFSQMIEAMKTAQQENFNLKLEKTIWQNVPIDFEDVWVVAMEDIRTHARRESPEKPVSIDLDKLLKKIKKEHPNLFINLKEFIPPQLNNQQ
ncbi:MAG TPA: DUF2603 domain-containing protein [Campylobacterales bacterium]|nr:DUF2603 domain-containing protein [Campylobacterales bacterium]